MAQKMTADEVTNLVHAAEGAACAVTAIQAAVSKLKIDDVPDAYELARSLIVAARDLNQTALAMLSRHDLQQQQAKLAAMK